ncbi:hypothetical protein A2Y83_00300 [Candidatus Falkowbacteria bacterium RBG_13_39_14]|uniref:Photosynthesis system II assembly factor Ycf48/Hcf136-like domain-containing protein n=1 Tax=Candidatus Falkowbacteria bacterium RBG_13_39_14 TaxID=1797985 RepID=A0A1F5S460_9BACT|nr:MAG: hypothetical protein A2Y83_00300 [Candidatus Falkowbacteria bacterium RBG_13_39_14]
MSIKKTILIIFALVFPLLLSGCIQIGESEDFGAVFKSLDMGASFAQKALVSTPQQSLVSISNADVTAMEIDPQDHNAIYIGTLANGLFYSYDGAESWHQAKDLGNYQISSIAINPDNKCVIYASSFNKIFISRDCNRTYREIYNDPRPQAEITRIAVDFYDPSVVLAGTSNGDILKSQDGGGSWHNLYDFKARIKDILIDRKDSDLIFVATAKDFYKTADGGINWESLGDNIREAISKSVSAYVKKIISVSSPETRALAALTDKNILVSIDGGNKWSDLKLVTPPGKVKIYSLAINPQNHREIYYGTATSFVKSADGGKTWTSSELPSARAPVEILVDPAYSNVVYMGMYKIES